MSAPHGRGPGNGPTAPVLIQQPVHQHSYETAVAAQEGGFLRRFVTGIYATGRGLASPGLTRALLLVSAVVFTVIHAAPGGPALLNQPDTDPKLAARLSQALHDVIDVVGLGSPQAKARMAEIEGLLGAGGYRGAARPGKREMAEAGAAQAVETHASSHKHS